MKTILTILIAGVFLLSCDHEVLEGCNCTKTRYDVDEYEVYYSNGSRHTLKRQVVTSIENVECQEEVNTFYNSDLGTFFVVNCN